MNTKLVLLATAILVLAPPAAAQTTDAGNADKATLEKVHATKPAYSPYVGRNYPTRPYFGDQHLHTAASMDAGAFGCRLTPADAYRLAMGYEITASSGQRVKLSRPLDWLAVTDHSDNMGFFPDLAAGKPSLLSDPTGKKWYDMMNSGKGADAAMDIIIQFSHGTFPKDLMYFPGTQNYHSAWLGEIKAAEEANQPGKFTAFIAYEWTSNTGGNNLHRNILFRGNGEQASKVDPYTVYPPYGSDNPADLWKWMETAQKTTGTEVLAIAHNGNLSSGLMFPVVEEFGKKIDRAYVEGRARWEPLYEVTQTKGTGEAHPFLSPNDEFAGFEIWDKGNLDGSIKKTKEMLEFEYARSAYKNGLKLEEQFGTNPYKFGLVSGSDAHTGMTAMEEDNFFGKTTPQEPSAERMTKVFIDNPKTGVKVMDWEVSASGYGAVWATENTREAIFDAMSRREVYATTGPRMRVRFFGGWGFERADASHPHADRTGYAKGVPMGADLPARPKGSRAPTFLVSALMDPEGARLDRVQIVKGWLERDGQTLRERIYDVVWAGERSPGPDGKLPPVGNTVDLERATYSNTIGAPLLATVWSDPDFDPALRAVYYARVLEIPTPRWVVYDRARLGAKIPEGATLVQQERAYTSPIWYAPGR